MKQTSPFVFALACAATLFSAGCGSGGGTNPTSPTNPTAQTGTVATMISDGPTEDWATIGVRVLSVALVPQGGGNPVTVYTAPSTPPIINLVQLDQLSEILGNDAQVPLGTYTAANLTLAANNSGTTCDTELVASGDPEAGFGVGAGDSVPCNQIVFAGAQGSVGSMTVPLSLTLDTPLSVTASSSNVLDLEFDLNNPTLIIEHDPAGAAAPTWVMNFNGPVHHHPRPDPTKIILRHHYAQVVSVSQDNTSITVNPAYPVHPVTTPETAIVDTNNTLTVEADATNGTLYYDLDTGSTPSTIMNFSTLASSLPKMFVRIAARYQQNGTLTATRIYASSSFDKIWQNPEGHVLHVNTTNNTMWVTTDDGKAKQIAIGANTAFYFQENNTAIGTGTAFFDGTTPGGLPNLPRGFKVDVTIDPLSTATPPTALTVEIDTARYDGTISSPTDNDFVDTRTFAMLDGRGGKDDYSGTIDYSTGPNVDQQGNAVTGFYWWDFAFPTKADEGSGAVNDFVNATGGSVNFGGTVGALKVHGLTQATWNDPVAADTWAARWTILTPVGAPVGAISTAFSTSTDSFAYTVVVPSTAASGTPPALPVTVDLSTTSGSATLVYQIDRQGGMITITPQDISNPATLQTVAGNLVSGVPVKVFGVPEVDGSLKAYMLFYYTHTASTE
jgi:hypothetical protein